MAKNAWAEAKWVVNKINDYNESIQGKMLAIPDNIPFKRIEQRDISTILLWYTWPDDTYIDDICICSVAGVKAILYTDISDLGNFDAGYELFDSTDSHQYSSSDLACEVIPFAANGGIALTQGMTYWIQLYPYSAEGVCNTNIENAIKFTYSAATIYGLRVNKNNSDPAKRVEYLKGYMNEKYTPAYMNYTDGVFDYGSWSDAWFITDILPCLIDITTGEIECALNPDNYGQNAEGETLSSDYFSTTGNYQVMIGIPKVWLKMYEEDGYQYYFFANEKVDDDYYAYAHTAPDTEDESTGNINYFYIGAYEAVYSNSKVFSLPDQTITTTTLATWMSNINTMTSALDYSSASSEWSLCTFAQRQLINALLLLIGRSTDGQTTFGYGRRTSRTKGTGYLDDKGLFYCASATSTNEVKVFGIENYWGSAAECVLGCILNQGKIKIKLTYNKNDESVYTGYNTTGAGYIVLDTPVFSKNVSGYITDSIVNQYGWFPVASGTVNSVTTTAASDKYECDYMTITYSSSATTYYYLTMGGAVDGNNHVYSGPWYFYLNTIASSGNHAARLSFTPSSTRAEETNDVEEEI